MELLIDGQRYRVNNERDVAKCLDTYQGRSVRLHIRFTHAESWKPLHKGIVENVSWLWMKIKQLENPYGDQPWWSQELGNVTH